METENKQDSKPKKGFFSKLNDMVFESSAPQEEVSTVSSTVVNNGVPSKFTYSDVAQNTTSNIPAAVMPNAGGSFDEKFYNNLLQIIESNNIDGIDYFEFAKAKKALDTTGIPDAMKYQAAFSTLKANSNLTKERLLETADFYIDKLNQEETGFNAEMQHEIESQVSSRLGQAKSKQEEIVRKQEDISKLQNEMNILQGEISALNVDAQQTQSKIELTARNFKVSLDVLKSQINTDKQNITNYIQQ